MKLQLALDDLMMSATDGDGDDTIVKPYAPSAAPGGKKRPFPIFAMKPPNLKAAAEDAAEPDGDETPGDETPASKKPKASTPPSKLAVASKPPSKLAVAAAEQERCLQGRECTDTACARLHPCTGHICGHRKGPGGQTWLTIGLFKVTTKRFANCTVYAARHTKYSKNRSKHNAKSSAKTKARKAATREAWEQAEHPEVDLSDAAKSDAADGAITIFDAALASALVDNPSVACNIFGASTGSEGFTIREEGEKSVLTTRGHDWPAIVYKAPAGDRRPLSSGERRSVGQVSLELYNAGNSKELSKHVETAVQRHVDALGDNRVKKLWRVTGAGYPKGTGPYKVGVRFFPRDVDGALTAPGGPFEFTF